MRDFAEQTERPARVRRVEIDPPDQGDAAEASPLLDLQRRAGNGAVARMVQTKLTVGRADDPAERAADDAAAQVMQRLGTGGAGPEAAPAGGDVLGGTQVSPEIASRISASSGKPLPKGTRQSMESGFGADFSDVRVHDGAEAADLNRSLQAKAFTAGNDVFIGKGGGSQDVLAHELAHVVQQEGGAAQRSVRRFVDVKTFKTRTSEGALTGKSTAQKTIEKLLIKYNALAEKGTISDTNLEAAVGLLEQMRSAADAWMESNTKGDGKLKSSRKKRGAGMAWFLMATDGEIASIEGRQERVSKAGAKNEAPKVGESSGDSGYDANAPLDTDEGPAKKPEEGGDDSYNTYTPIDLKDDAPKGGDDAYKYTSVDLSALDLDDDDLSMSEEEPVSEAPVETKPEESKKPGYGVYTPLGAGLDDDDDNDLSLSDDDEDEVVSGEKKGTYAPLGDDLDDDDDNSISITDTDDDDSSFMGAGSTDSKFDGGKNKAPTKYDVKKVGTHYKDEFTKGSVVLAEIYASLKSRPIEDAKKIMMTQFGWTSDDFDTKWSKAKTITDPGVDDPDKLSVAKVEDKDKNSYKLDMGGSIRQGSAPEPFDTKGSYSKFAGAGWAIFVMSGDGEFYAGSHKVGLFHHSSFLAGGDVGGAGELQVSGGSLKGLTNKSGHYEPAAEQMVQVFEEIGASKLSGVKYTHIYGPKGSQKQEYDAAFFYNTFKARPETAPH